MNPNDGEFGKEYRNRILLGDALAVLKTLPSESIDCAISSPPFFGARDYGRSADSIWDGDPSCKHNWVRAPGSLRGRLCRKCGAFKGQLGHEPTVELYARHLVQILSEVKRVLKKEGTLWLNLGDCHYSRNKYGRHPCLKNKDLIGVPWQVAFALRADGWYLRLDNVWFKPNCLPESVTDRPTKSHEYVFLMSKSSKYFYDQDAVREPCAQSSLQRVRQKGFWKQKGGDKDYGHGTNPSRSARKTLENFARNPNGRNLRSVWKIPTQPFADEHCAVFPEQLARLCILAGCPEWVCKHCGKARTKIVEKKIMDKGKSYSDKTADAVKTSATSALRLKHKKVERRVVGYTDCGCGLGFDRGTILDPFMGAGTTAKVAQELHRNFVGIEINPNYVRIASKRLREATRTHAARSTCKTTNIAGGG